MRDTFIDSSKAILIFLVVLGHFLERFIGFENEVNAVILKTIYFVHMPAFIFISGALFKSDNMARKLVFFLSLLIPFQVFYIAFDYFVNGHFSLAWLLKPYWILWYLAGMIAWSVITPILQKTKLAVLISIILSVVIGLSPIDNYIFSIGRIFTFLPFFVIGSIYGKQILDATKSKKSYAFIGMIILILIMLISKFTDIDIGWLYGSMSFKQLATTNMMGALTRLSVFAVSCLGIFAILSLSQLFRAKFVSLGQHTLPVYLFHGFAVIILACFLKFENNFQLGFIVSVILSIIICYILSLQIFDKLIKAISSILMRFAK